MRVRWPRILAKVLRAPLLAAERLRLWTQKHICMRGTHIWRYHVPDWAPNDPYYRCMACWQCRNAT